MDIHNHCCMMSELGAVVAVSGVIKETDRNDFHLKIVTENAAFARRIFSFIRRLCEIHPDVTIRRSSKLKKHISYTLWVTAVNGAALLLDKIGMLDGSGKGNMQKSVHFDINRLVKKDCCKKAFLRGAFLAGGSISDPEKTYHLEITTHTMSLAQELSKLTGSFHLNARIIKRKGNYVTYLKEGEHIVDFLNVAGAHLALLELENIRILKGMRNDVNRIVNCETANLEKTVAASLRQVENIEYIRDYVGFEKLPESLQEIARLRVEHSDASLKELGEMLTPPLGKSGVNHRLRKLDEIAERERELRGSIL